MIGIIVRLAPCYKVSTSWSSAVFCHIMLPEAAAVLLLSVSSSCYLLAKRLRKSLHTVVTGVDDIPYLGQGLPDAEKLDATAVICGGR